MQDRGVKYDKLCKSIYQRNEIIYVGADNYELFFYVLTAITVNYTKIMGQEKD